MILSRNKNRVRESGASRVFNVALIIFMVLLAAVMVYPYLNVVAKAFNEGYDTMLGGVTFYPRAPTLDNFAAILNSELFTNAFFISVARVICGTVLALIVQFSAAYAFTKKELKGRNALLIYLTIPMFFGGGLIPQFMLYSKIGLLNNFLVYIIPGAFSLYNMVIIRSYLYTLPESLQESARLDGAGEIRILTSIITPMAMPILATVALWTAVGQWNDWTTTLYFVTKQKLFTLQFLLMRMLKQFEELNSIIESAIRAGRQIDPNSVPKIKPESIQAAQIVITTVPIILVYPFLQKYFIKGIVVGAIKD